MIDKSTRVLTDFIKNLSLIDMWKSLNPEMVDFTFVDPSSNMCNSRIDMILCSHTLNIIMPF